MVILSSAPAGLLVMLVGSHHRIGFGRMLVHLGGLGLLAMLVGSQAIIFWAPRWISTLDY
jgi:hypothetical protein